MDKEMYDCLHEMNENLKAIKTNTTPTVIIKHNDTSQHVSAAPKQLYDTWNLLKSAIDCDNAGLAEKYIREIDLLLGED